jgi:DNA-binding NarL/FixJ family response regulator
MSVKIVFWGNHNNVDATKLLPDDIAKYANLIEVDDFDHLITQLNNDDQIKMIIICLNPTDLQTLVRIQQLQTQYPDIALVAVLDTMLSTSMVAETMRFLLGGHAKLIEEMTPVRDEVNCVELAGPYQENPIATDTPVYHLTARQKDVLGLVMLGKSNKEIARVLNLTEGTIKIHCMAIFRELRVTNRTQAAILAEQVIPELAIEWNKQMTENNLETRKYAYV